MPSDMEVEEMEIEEENRVNLTDEFKEKWKEELKILDQRFGEIGNRQEIDREKLEQIEK